MALRLWRNPWKLISGTVRGFLADDAMTLGAGLAFYSALSLAPMIVLLLWIAGSLAPDLREDLVKQIVSMVGQQGGKAVESIAESGARRPDLGNIAGIFSVIMLLFSAAAVFGQLQHSLNLIWEVKAKPKEGIRGWLRKRLLSFGMVITLGFLLLVSLAVSTVLAAASDRIQDPGGTAAPLWELVNFIVSTVVFSLFFGAMYKFLPDVKISWRQVAFASLLTGVLFAVGKIAIGIYLGRASVGSEYGAAGSLLVLLIWVYYSSLIVFFGAELTQQWAAMTGHAIQPNAHAEWIDERSRNQARAAKPAAPRAAPQRRDGAAA